MTWFDSFQIAIHNIQHSKLRFTLTCLGVVIAIATLVSMVSFGAGLRRETVGNLETRELFSSFRVVGARQAQNLRRFRGQPPAERESPALDDALVKKLSKIPGVQSVQPDIVLPVQLKNGNHAYLTRVQGGGPHIAPLSPFSRITDGRFLSGVSGREIVLSYWVAERLGFNPPQAAVGSTIELLTDRMREEAGEDDPPIETIRFPYRVVGVLPRVIVTQRNPFYMGTIIPLDEARKLWDQSLASMAALSSAIAAEQGRGREYPAIDVRVDDVANMDRVRREVESWGNYTFAIADEMDTIMRAFLILETILSVLGAIALLVASLGIANVLIMSVMERTQQIGIMKAVGGTDQDVRRIFLLEAGCIGMVGGILGLISGWGLTRVADFFIRRYFEQHQFQQVPDLFDLPLWLILGALAFSTAFSTISGLVPAQRAARIDPARALRTG
ncbi:MAG: ABC transporter permease [Acidobacteria bacterium]|nr:ABC transporter permease [Acidobacteriota bacterium]